MGNDGSAGYAVLDLRVSELEKDVKDISQDFKAHVKQNDMDHKEMRAGITEGALSLRESKLMFSQISSNIDDLKKTLEKNDKDIREDLKSLNSKHDKEKGWRAIIIDILKVMAMIIGFIATGKIIF
ncbi:hypothetical protein ACRC6Q_16830 [Planococcus sp. SE5232]|uniref:hypothetical protein n=1 Tax=unclassified Planococcus (in: firmicutes) TaxID=2662419 RepID=UPI003D6B4C44